MEVLASLASCFPGICEARIFLSLVIFVESVMEVLASLASCFPGICEARIFLSLVPAFL